MNKGEQEKQHENELDKNKGQQEKQHENNHEKDQGKVGEAA